MLSGRVALVTGAARGLGAAIVARLADAGATGIALDRVPAAAPPGWRAVTGDVTDRASLDAAVARLDRLDIVVANAGLVPPWRAAGDVVEDEWDATLAVNVRGVAATIAAAVPALREGASIVAIASINARRAHPRQALYTASKHAVAGLVRATAADLGRAGVRVNAVAPGPVATEALLERMADRAAGGGTTVADALAAAASETALGRLATEREVADAVVFLAGDLASGITGQLLAVDAGIP